MELQNLVRPKNVFVCFLYRSKKKRVGRSEKSSFIKLYFCQECVFYACFLMIGCREG